MTAVDPDAVAHARRVLNEVRSHWLARRGVTGIDVGLREVKGELSSEVAIRIYVSRKYPLDRLPEHERFPTEVDGVRVDIIEFEPLTP